MSSAAWTIARNDVRVWWRMRAAVAAAVATPLGLAAVVLALTAAVGRQPVALVEEDHSPLANHMVSLIREDAEAYNLKVVSADKARGLLHDLAVAAIITVPADFDARVAHDDAHLELVLNNVDVDFADDIRRAVDRSVAQFDAPDLGLLGELRQGQSSFVLPNPYRVDVAEHNLRKANVSYRRYQVVPIIVLLVLNLGLLGSGAIVARGNETGTAKMLRVAPLRRSAITAGHLAGGLLMTLAALLPVLVVGRMVGWVEPPIGHWRPLALLLLALSLFAIAAGVLLGTVLRRVRTLTMVGLNAATYLFFLGGGFTTMAYLPSWIQSIARLAPTSYGIDGLRQTLFYPELTNVSRDIEVLAATAVVALFAATAALHRSWSRA